MSTIKRFIISLCLIFTILLTVNHTAAEDISHTTHTAHDTIQSITYNESDHTYYAFTTHTDSCEWCISLLQYPFNNQTILDQFQHDLIGKSVTIQYDDNGGSDNFEDWSVDSWSVDDVQYK